MLSGISTDGGLHLGDGDVLASQILFGQGIESQAQSLAIHRVIAVARTSVALRGEGLADGTQVILQVHLDHLEDRLTLQSRRSLISLI